MQVCGYLLVGVIALWHSNGDAQRVVADFPNPSGHVAVVGYCE